MITTVYALGILVGLLLGDMPHQVTALALTGILAVRHLVRAHDLTGRTRYGIPRTRAANSPPGVQATRVEARTDRLQAHRAVDQPFGG